MAKNIRFQRANYLVSDLERAFTFYRDILGFSVEFIKQSKEDSYSYPVFEIDRSKAIRFAVLSTAEQPRCMALTEVQGGELPDMAVPRRSAIVVHTDDFDGTAEAARDAGLKVFDEYKLVTQDGREGREQAIIDFDGNLALIYTITKAAG